MTSNRSLLAYLRERQTELIALLTQLVERESPAEDRIRP
jgi:hypothetical protein